MANRVFLTSATFNKTLITEENKVREKEKERERERETCFPWRHEEQLRHTFSGPRGGKVASNYRHTLSITVSTASRATKLSHGGRCVGIREIETHFYREKISSRTRCVKI